MMNPPIFQICANAPAVVGLLGALPTRLYPFGEAPKHTQLPYAVWQIITGAPENYLDDVPDIDQYTIQVDVYAQTGGEAESVAKALRDAIEPRAHIVRWGVRGTDPQTRHKNINFDIEWLVPR